MSEAVTSVCQRKGAVSIGDNGFYTSARKHLHTRLLHSTLEGEYYVSCAIGYGEDSAASLRFQRNSESFEKGVNISGSVPECGTVEKFVIFSNGCQKILR